MQTFTTVGYGDTPTTSSLERFFGVLVMLMGVFVFTYVSGSLSSILMSADSAQAEQTKQMERLQGLSYSYKFPKRLVSKLRFALTYETKTVNDELEEMIAQIPVALRAQVYAHIFPELDVVYPFFK